MRRGSLVAFLLLALFAAPASAGYDPPVSGTNNFSCRPSAAHPEPLVLVHGLGATYGYNWNWMGPRLAAAGYCVFGLTYGVDSRTTAWPYSPGGSIPMERSATELAAFVDRVLAATGATKVDLVGHSEGTVMPRYYLKHLGGDQKVDRFVAMTPLWRGTNVAMGADFRDAAASYPLSPVFWSQFSSFCGSCPEFLRDSAFLQDLNAGGEAVPGITYTSIATRYDELVQPYTSGIMDDPNATNIVIQDVCPTDTSEHAAVAFDPVALQMVLNALDPANAKPVTC